MNPCELINSFWLFIEALIAQHGSAEGWLKAHTLLGLCHILEVIRM